MKTVSLLAALALATSATVVLAHAGGGWGAGGFERLRAADTNGDGLLSRTEVAALPRLAERFDSIDANDDGQVSFEELQAFRTANRGKHAGKFGGKFGGKSGAMMRADTDGDGRVSRDEALARAAERFERLDADKDGFITREEMTAARGAHRMGRGSGPR